MCQNCVHIADLDVPPWLWEPGMNRKKKDAGDKREWQTCILAVSTHTPLLLYIQKDHIRGVLVGVLAYRAVDRVCDALSCHIKELQIGICCFFITHTSLRRKTNNWLDQN
jgi:hypothetical protein